MDFESRILARFPNSSIHEIQDEVLLNPVLLNELFPLIYHTNLTVAWRTVWIMEKIQFKNPALLFYKTDELIEALPHFKHQGSKRCTLKILENTAFKEYPVSLINLCFDWLLSPKETIAVRAICVKILYKICVSEPDFVPELHLCLSELSSETSSGMRSIIRHTLKALEKINQE
ncbi:MAG: hypothetical protein LBR75_00175 [Prevotellaceae bacterium]|jgi:hypothetical protein|nr:hypothetical protein [Prevotellaceae bacterium]